MKKYFVLFISTCFVIVSCDNSKETDIAYNKGQNNKAETSKLNDLLKKYEEPSQIFKISAAKPVILYGKKGTKIFVNPEDLITESGSSVGKNIQVELKELTNQADLLSTNAQTVSDGKILVSGGAYFIGMTSDGQQLKLKDGKNLSIQFPKLSDNAMSLFYGRRNESGQMNWQKATETFKETQKTDTASLSRAEIGWDSSRGLTNPEIDAIIDYVDSTADETPQQKKARQKDNVVIKKVYDAIEINSLGWINCDRFLEMENKTELVANFNAKDSIGSANVFLIFKDINSVMQAYYTGTSLAFGNIPVGYKTRLIAYTVKNEKVFAYSSDLTISKGQRITLVLKEINEKDFKQLVGK